MSPAEKRLAFLEKVTSEGSSDPFVWYGLAMQYRNLERFDDALRIFHSLRESHVDYVPMYLMCGQMLEKWERPDDARMWYEQGITQAKAKGDTHALGELEAAHEGLSSV